MSDRIAVLCDGRVQQVGESKTIYEAPENTFVANFIGETNLLDVAVSSLSQAKADCVLPGGQSICCAAASGAQTGRGHVSIRPERLSITSTAAAYPN